MEEHQEDSSSLTPKGGRRTKKTAERTLAKEQEWEILQQAIRRYAAAGGKVMVVHGLWWGGEHGDAVFFPGGSLATDDVAINGNPTGG